MAEYIDKQDAIDVFKQFRKRKWISMPIEHVIEILSVIPYVEIEPVKHGHWVKYGSPLFSEWECSECGERHTGNDLLDECPNCGAKMDGGENEYFD